jgi:hypothetical protein
MTGDVIGEIRLFWHSVAISSIEPYLKEADEIMLHLSRFENEEALAILDLARARLRCCVAQSRVAKSLGPTVGQSDHST